MGGRLGPLGPGQTMTLNVTSQPGMPASTIPTAVIVNLTIADATAPTYLTVYPTGAARPLASDINSGVGDVRANLVIVKVGSNGSVDIFNYSGTATVVVDIVGWYQ
jgi:hypothetical protein